MKEQSFDSPIGPVQIVFLESIDELVSTWLKSDFDLDEYEDEDICGMLAGDDDMNTKLIPEERTVGQFKKDLAEVGFWGFCDGKKIYAWHDGKRSMVNLVEFFAHELGHMIRPIRRNHLREEYKANRYSDVAKFAVRVAESVLGVSK